MPRVKAFVSAAQQAIEDDLRNRYGGMMTATDVASELSLNHYSAYMAWLADVPATIVNGRRRWRVSAVAAKIYKSTEAI